MRLSNRFRIMLVLPGFVFASLAFRSQSSAATFQGLGNPPGRFHSWAADVSADGSVVVGYLDSISEGAFQAFRWTPSEGMVLLGYLPGGEFHSMAWGVSPDGSVVVGRSDSDWGTGAFRWTESDGMIGLGDLPGGNFWSHAYAVSENGSAIVGFGYSASGQEAFRWTAANGMVALGRGQAYDVSPDGTVVVGTSNGHAFRWTEDTGMVELGDLPGGKPYSGACAVSADGAVVVGGAYSALGLECFRWTSETGMVGLGLLQCSDVFAVSHDGSIVLANVQTAMVMKPYIWDSANGMRPLQDVLELDYGLDLTGWDLWEATAMSADGSTIVGSAMKSDGYVEAWIATIHKLKIQAEINIVPNTLNLRSKGKSISCRIFLPDNYSVADIDPDSILLEDEVPADRIWLLNKFAVAKFSRSALRELLADLDTPATVELLVSGRLNDATPFEGTDIIRVIGKGLTRGRRVNSNSKVVDDIEYYIQTDKAVYNLGENVEMLYRVTNLGDQEVSLWFPHSPVYNFWVAKDGQDIWQAVNAWWTVITTVVLAPGESKEFPYYDPPMIWDMSDTDGDSVSPGKYTVTAGLYAGSGLWDFTRVSVDIRIISDHVIRKELSVNPDTIRPIDKPRKPRKTSPTPKPFNRPQPARRPRLIK